jgi:hypothetical protein
MRSSILCRERLDRIQRILARNAGALTVRTLSRSYHVQPWEIEQAAALGWLEIITRKPHTGRPSRIVREVSKPEGAKLPPFRWQMEKGINYRHSSFGLYSTHAVKHGSRWLASHGLSLPCITDVYQQAYPRARSRKAAAASASRLMRRSDVRAARAWYYARFDGDAPRSESMPDTASAIWQRLRELGSWRAGPRITIGRK